jgi:cell division protein FtsX
MVAATTSLTLRFGWALRLTTQGLRRHRRSFFVSAAAFALAAAALAACLGYARRAVPAAATTGTAQLVAFLDDALPETDRDELARALGQLAGVASVRVLSSDEALGRMRAELGARAAVLDGVEEGFLPTTLEISLRPGRQGAGRADELAWRLRRMGGISDVDVLRSEADHRLVEEQEASRRLRGVVLALGGLAALGALLLAAVVLRQRRADAFVLAGLGFTPSAVHGPAFLAGAGAACLGAGAIVVLLRASLHLGGAFPVPVLAVPALAIRLFAARWQLAAVLAMTLLGGMLGWWGSRLPGRKGDELAARV